MADNKKHSFSEVQRQDRGSLLRKLGIGIGVVFVLLIAFVFFHVATGDDESTEPIAPENAELTMVPTTINYYDPQSEKTYDVGADYVILSTGDGNFMKVSSDGSVSRVSSDGTYLSDASNEERDESIKTAVSIMRSDNQASMALNGLEDAASAIKEEEEKVPPPEPTALDTLYAHAESMGILREDLNRQIYMMGATPEDAASLIENGADSDAVIKSIMGTQAQDAGEKSEGIMSVSLQQVGIQEEPVAAKDDDGEVEYPSWMQEADPTAGMDALVSTLSSVASSGSASAWDTTNKNADKLAWQEEQQKQEVKASRLTRYDLVAGTTVPITIVTGVNTDLPGQIIGIVRQDVYDTLTGTNVLIPKGSRLIATYNNSVSFGQKSVQIAWNQLITTDGYQFSLPGFSGTTPDGYAGVKDKYSNHFWSMLGGAVLGSLLDWGSVYASNQVQGLAGNNEIGELIGALAGSTINTSASVGQQYASMWANRQPTITIRTGTETQLLVNQTISLRRPNM